jgi:hypothetical protein
MGPGFFKGGHNNIIGDQAICVEKTRRCVLFLSNDVRAESIFQRLAEAALGDLGMPWSWEGALRPGAGGGEVPVSPVASYFPGLGTC